MENNSNSKPNSGIMNSLRKGVTSVQSKVKTLKNSAVTSAGFVTQADCQEKVTETVKQALADAAAAANAAAADKKGDKKGWFSRKGGKRKTRKGKGKKQTKKVKKTRKNRKGKK